MSDRRVFTVGERASLDVRTHSSAVEVYVGQPGSVVVTVDQPDRWNVSNVGDAVVITPVGKLGRRAGRVAVEVPDGTRVEFRSASADLRIDGDLGAVTVSTASGDLRHHGRCSSLAVASASGDVRCSGVDGDLEVTSVSGDIEVGDIGGRVEITTTSGDVRLGQVAGDLSVGSTSGDVRIRRADGTELELRTISGDVRVGLPTGIRVCPELTTFSGSTRLPEPRRDTGQDDERPRRLVRLTVKSVSGDIDIQRAD